MKGKGELRKKLARKVSNEVQNSWVRYHTSLIFVNLCIGREIMIFRNFEKFMGNVIVNC
jgi:hypothetical protein